MNTPSSTADYPRWHPGRWLRPAPGSIASLEQSVGRSPWLPMVHLAWSIWVFMPPLLSEGAYGFTPRWFLLTAISYPLFLGLFVTAIFGRPHTGRRAAFAMVALCLALMPWYPSGMSYFVFGCVMMQPRRNQSVPAYFLLLAGCNALLFACGWQLQYPREALIWIVVISIIISLIVLAESRGRERELALKLSHEEVRRLAALAERERIGRDLHDLLGHTLSMVSLKSQLAGRLLERDPAAARREIDEVSRVAREALTQVRHAVSGIRAAGIAAELASARLLLETDDIRFEQHFDPGFSDVHLSAEAESALAMTVREAATNIQRHARARSARFEFRQDAATAVLIIRDDGRGGRLTPGTGLSGMCERLEAAGGCLKLESRSGEGTRIEARVPLVAPSFSAAEHLESA